jgi:small subunit ribosomal protein S20
MRNKPIRTRARTTMRAALEALDAAAGSGEWEAADAAIGSAVRALDAAATGGVIHANNAARRKSRLLRRYSTLRNPDDVAKRPHTRPPEPAKESATA